MGVVFPPLPLPLHFPLPCHSTIYTQVTTPVPSISPAQAPSCSPIKSLSPDPTCDLSFLPTTTPPPSPTPDSIKDPSSWTLSIHLSPVNHSKVVYPLSIWTTPSPAVHSLLVHTYIVWTVHNPPICTSYKPLRLIYYSYTRLPVPVCTGSTLFPHTAPNYIPQHRSLWWW